MTRKDIFGKLRLLPFFATFIIAGCTLMMDEVDEPEPEEVGFDEVATYEDEYVTVSYQYQDGVQPVTENVLEYVVESDDPSLLYLMDNVPEKWVPKEGEYVAGGCNPKIPDGLCRKVVGVPHENGMYIIELAPATEDEVYKELEYTADFDYNMPSNSSLQEIDSTMTDEEKAAATFYDWSIYNGTNADSVFDDSTSEEIKTRANGDLVVEDKKETNYLVDFHFDTRFEKDLTKGPGKIVKGELLNFCKALNISATPYFALNLIRKDELHYHTYHNKHTKTDSVYTISTPHFDFRTELGLDFDGKLGANDAGHWADTKKFYDYCQKHADKLKALGKTSRLAKFERTSKGAIRIPTGCPVPLCIIIEPTVEPILTIGGAVGGHWKWTGDTYKQGTVQQGDYKKEIKEEIKKGSFQLGECYVHGYIKFGVLARLGLGVELARSATVTVGIGAEASVELGYDNSKDAESLYDLGKDLIEPYRSVTNMSYNIQVKGFIDLKVTFSPLGLFDLWGYDYQFGTFPIYDRKKSIGFGITIPEAPGSLIAPSMLSDDKPENIQYKFSYRIHKVGDGVYAGNFVPKVRVYDKDMKYLFEINAKGFEDNSPKKLELKTYLFDETKTIKKSDLSYDISKYAANFVPLLWRPYGDCYVFPTLKTKITNQSPDMHFHGITQTYGGPMKKSRAKTYNLKTDEFDFTDDRSCYTEFYEFRFNLDYDVENGSLMQWTKFLFEVRHLTGGTVENLEGPILLSKEIKQKAPKSGKFTYDVAFAMRNEDVDKSLVVEVTPSFKGITDTDMSTILKKWPLLVKKDVDNNPGKSSYGTVKSVSF